MKLAFKIGQVDKISNLQDSDDFLNWKTVIIDKSSNNNSFVGLFYNTEDEKLSDKSIRQALSYAIDKTNFDGERAIGPISPDSWGYNPQVKPYERDLEKAKDAKDFKITVSTLPNLLKTAEKIKRDWEEAGISCEVQVVTGIPDNFQAFLATVDIPKDPDQYSLWHSTQTTTNISNFKNARIDKLLEDGRTELDQETRKKTYLDFQRFLVEDVPAVFLYHPNSYTVTRK
jgi:peptide/nickel transport system substrate-binding protein